MRSLSVFQRVVHVFSCWKENYQDVSHMFRLHEGGVVRCVVSFDHQFIPRPTAQPPWHDDLEYTQNFQMWPSARTGNLQAPCPWPRVCWTEGLPAQSTLPTRRSYRMLALQTRKREKQRQIILHYVIVVLSVPNTSNSVCRLIHHYRLFASSIRLFDKTIHFKMYFA
jgi:hypothetical protein